MKRLGVLFLAIMMIVSLVGCAGSVNANTDKKALLIVSFGSSFIENREASIDATEKVIEEAFPDYDKFTAFTSQIIIDIYADRDNVEYLNVNQQIENIYKAGYGEVLVVPTHVINGEEYDSMIEDLHVFQDKFTQMTISKPLLSSISDYERVVEALVNEMPVTNEKEAVVLMGHGTHHDANSAYAALDYKLKHSGQENVYVGTVEGSPSFDNVLADLEKQGYEKITLMPLMIVAGDHAHNDMAGDEEDSWKVMLKSQGYDVEYIMKGLGELPSIQQLFVEHANEALQAQ